MLADQGVEGHRTADSGPAGPPHRIAARRDSSASNGVITAPENNTSVD